MVSSCLSTCWLLVVHFMTPLIIAVDSSSTGPSSSRLMEEFQWNVNIGQHPRYTHLPLVTITLNPLTMLLSAFSMTGLAMAAKSFFAWSHLSLSKMTRTKLNFYQAKFYGIGNLYNNTSKLMTGKSTQKFQFRNFDTK